MRDEQADLRYVFLHWTAGDYEETFPAYHFCVTLRNGAPAVVATHEPAANARDLRATEDPYAAHVAGRNSHALGVAICGMRDATPHDFGAYPLRDDLVDVACAHVAKLCAAYRIALDADHVRTHAEAALDDGYFGAGPDERWDVARLTPSAAPLAAEEARLVGDVLRARIRAHAEGPYRGAALWAGLVLAIVAWSIFLWHPWIDWFGR